MPSNSIVRIGNAQGFWGDRPSAAADLLSLQPNLDYLTLDYLAEVSLSIMAIQKELDPNAGYAKDFLEVLTSLVAFWQKGSAIKVISNAGGLNPLECAKECRKLLDKLGCSSLKIGVVLGDSVLVPLQENPHLYPNLDTKEPLENILHRLITANAYIGAKPIVDLLKQGCSIVITGRAADPSLTVAPCMAHHSWSPDDYNLIAQATIAGHLIECGTQVTGGVTTDWLENFSSVDEAARLSFPYVEMSQNGDFVITKPQQGSGRVDQRTVKEQLLYELGDPCKYLSPDATVSIEELQLKVIGKDRVQISGAKGRPPPNSYKVSATFRDGYKAEATLAIFGPQAKRKAQLCGEIILKRVEQAGFKLERSLIECIGAGNIAKNVVSFVEPSFECLLRIAAADPRKEALECFAREIAPLITSGPQGITGYTSGRPPIRQVFGFWPCLIGRHLINPQIQVI